MKNGENSLSNKIIEYAKKRKHLRIWSVIMVILAMIVFCAVGLKLRYIGQALTHSEMVLCCEVEEHLHEDMCYSINEDGEEVLVCELEEHVHSDECYEEVYSSVDETTVESDTAQVSETEMITEEHTIEETESIMTSEAESEMQNESELEVETETETQTETETAIAMTFNLKNNLVLNETNENGTPLEVKQVTIVEESSSIQYDEYTETFLIKGLRIEFIAINKSLIEADYKGYFNLPPEVVIPDNLFNKEYDLNRVSEKIGSYYFAQNDDGTYTVHVRVDSDKVSEEDEELVGYIQFDSSIKKKENTGGKDIVLDFGEVSLVISQEKIDWGGPEKSENYHLHVEKHGGYNVVDKQLEYQVIVSTNKGTPDEITFVDTFYPQGLAIQNLESFEITDGNGQVVNVDAKDMKQNANGTWTISAKLPKLSANEKYMISYHYKIEPGIDDVARPQNKVETSSTDKKTGESVTAKAELTVEVNSKYTLYKNGWVRGDLNRNFWTIDINSQKQNIAGAKLYDDAFSMMTHLTISPSAGYRFETDENGKKYILFTDTTGSNENYNSYHLEYQTPVEYTLEGKDYVNKAKLEGDEWEVEYTHTIHAVLGYANKWVDSNHVEVADDKKTLSIPWKVVLTIPNVEDPVLQQGTVMKDSMSEYLCMTRENIMEWGGKFFFLDNEYTFVENQDMLLDASDPAYQLTFLGNNGKEYSYAEVLNNTEETIQYVSWSLKLPADIHVPKGKLALGSAYNTTASIDTMGEKDIRIFQNEINFGPRKATSQYQYKNYATEDKFSVIKRDGKGNTDSSHIENKDGRLTWNVEIETDNSSYPYLMIVDTLPKGVFLRELHITCPSETIEVEMQDGKLSGKKWNYEVSGIYDTDTGKTELKLWNMYGNINGSVKLLLTYECQLSKELLVKGSASNLTNKVEVTTKNGEYLGGDEQTQHWKYPEKEGGHQVIDKNGIYDENNKRINYRVEINPKGLDLLKDGDELILSDYLEYYTGPYRESREEGEWEISKRTMELDRTSVKLYHAKLDEKYELQKVGPVDDNKWSWTISEERKQIEQTNGNDKWYTGTDLITKKIETKIPDETPLILEYSYVIDITPANKNAPCKIGAKNRVSLQGLYNADADGLSEVVYKEIHTSGGVLIKKSYTFYKVKKGSYGTGLANAKFGVYKISNPYVENAQAELVTEYTTDKFGVFTICFEDKMNETAIYEENTLYYAVETVAPEGYLLPTKPPRFYFYFSRENETFTPHSSYKAVDLSDAIHADYVENEPLPTTCIDIEKKWHKFGGEKEMESHQIPKSITVVLHQSFSEEREHENSVIGTYVIEEMNFYVKPGTKTEYNNLLLERNGNWKGKIDDLPISQDGKTCYYWIEEIEVNGEPVNNYDISYEPFAAITDGKVKIINTYNQSYELPETGGKGTILFRLKRWCEERFKKIRLLI